MSERPFTPIQIRNGLRKACSTAFERCGRQFSRHAQSRRFGLEKIFQDSFLAAVPDEWSKDETRRSTLGKIPIERDGRIDALLRYGDFRLGVEFKVCVLPRQRDLSPKRVLYDIGQISLDHGCLKHYSINSAYCIVILYGRLVEMSGTTRQRVVRHFHNAMFVDYHTSMEFGELSSECSDRERRFQIQSIKEIGFDHPFPPDHRKVRLYDFCQLNNRLNVAVVGLWVK